MWIDLWKTKLLYKKIIRNDDAFFYIRTLPVSLWSTCSAATAGEAESWLVIKEREKKTTTRSKKDLFFLN